jgi:hypothetical protein
MAARNLRGRFFPWRYGATQGALKKTAQAWLRQRALGNVEGNVRHDMNNRKAWMKELQAIKFSRDGLHDARDSANAKICERSGSALRASIARH